MPTQLEFERAEWDRALTRAAQEPVEVVLERSEDEHASTLEQLRAETERERAEKDLALAEVARLRELLRLRG